MVGRTKKSAVASRRKPLRSGVPVHVNEERLAQVNKEIRELENFVDMIQAQVVKYKKDCKAELERMAEMEQEDFQRARMKIPAEQLTMLVPEIEKLWTAAKENDVWVDEGKEDSGAEKCVEIKPAVIKVPARLKRTKRKSERRTSVAKPLAILSTPVNPATYRIRRTSPKFLTTGIKDVKPRAGRVGELAYSENGSPLVVVVDPRRLKLPLRAANAPLAEAF